MLLSANTACVPGMIVVTYAFNVGTSVNVDEAGNDDTPVNGIPNSAVNGVTVEL